MSKFKIWIELRLDFVLVCPVCFKLWSISPVTNSLQMTRHMSGFFVVSQLQNTTSKQ